MIIKDNYKCLYRLDGIEVWRVTVLNDYIYMITDRDSRKTKYFNKITLMNKYIEEFRLLLYNRNVNSIMHWRFS